MVFNDLLQVPKITSHYTFVVAKSGDRFAQDAKNELEIGKLIAQAHPENKFQSKLNLVDDFVIEVEVEMKR